MAIRSFDFKKLSPKCRKSQIWKTTLKFKAFYHIIQNINITKVTENLTIYINILNRL